MIDPIQFAAFPLRRVQPYKCDIMRSYVNQQAKLFHETILRDLKRMTNTFSTSSSNNLPTALTAVNTAYATVSDEIATQASKYYTELIQTCDTLGSFGLMGTITKLTETLRKDQMDVGQNLTRIPKDFDDEMQSNYVPLEKIIGARP